MEHMETTLLWLAVYNAYESRDAEEARRLLQSEESTPDCSIPLRCGDLEYVRWLLSNDLIPRSEQYSNIWPELEEIQLQCNALNEPARPACILNGDLPDNAEKK